MQYTITLRLELFIRFRAKNEPDLNNMDGINNNGHFIGKGVSNFSLVPFYIER